MDLGKDEVRYPIMMAGAAVLTFLFVILDLEEFVLLSISALAVVLLVRECQKQEPGRSQARECRGRQECQKHEPGRSQVLSHTCIHPGCETKVPAKSTFCEFHKVFRRVPDAKFREIENQFKSTWRVDGRQAPRIREIWDIHAEHLVAKHDGYCRNLNFKGEPYGRGVNPGNQQRRFHGTKMTCTFNGTPCARQDCYACSIMKHGFLMSKVSNNCFFGKGIYATASSSTACRYAKLEGDGAWAVIMVGVACGNAHKLKGDVDLADNTDYHNSGPPDPQFHSRIVENPESSKSYKNHRTKFGWPRLPSKDEIIVFNDDAIVPKYLILVDPAF